jgi:hypothetical protein
MRRAVLRPLMVSVCCGVLLTAQSLPEKQAASASGVIVGRVVDHRGAGVARAVVRLSGSGQDRFESNALTDDHGDFFFANLPAGQFWLRATKDGYAEAQYRDPRSGSSGGAFNMSSGERRMDVLLTLAKLAAVSGRVTDDRGLPLLASISVFRPTVVAGHLRLEGVAIRGGQTDDRGEYRIFNLVPATYVIGFKQPFGSFRVSSTASDLRAPGMIRLAPGEDRSGVDFRIAPLSTVRVAGAVAGSGPQTRTYIQLLRHDAPLAGDSSQNQVGPDGRFVFDAVPPGRYTIRAAQIESQAVGGNASAFSILDLTVGDRPIEDIVLQFRPYPRLTGRIEFAGTTATPDAAQIARNPFVGIETADGSFTVASGPQIRMTADGQFVATGLTPGRYLIGERGNRGVWTIRSAMLGGRDLSVTPFEVGGEDINGVVITLTDRISSVSGMVRDASGQPAPDSQVVIFPVDRSLWTDYGQSSRRLRSVPADVGSYSLRLPPGEYYIAAIPVAIDSLWRAPDVLSRLATTADRLVLVEGDRMKINPRLVDVK